MEEYALEKSIHDFMRDALAARYALDNIRKYPGFDAMPDEQVVIFRNFGMKYIFPDWDSRCFQKEAFEALKTLLNDPIRMKPLAASGLQALWRFGPQLPHAIDTGKSLAHLFESTERIENRLNAILLNINSRTEVPEYREIAMAVTLMPREEYESFITDMTAFMKIILDRELLYTAYGVVKDFSTVMNKRQECFLEIERKGMHYAFQVLEEGLMLLDTMVADAMRQVITIVPRIERDWLDSLSQCT